MLGLMQDFPLIIPRLLAHADIASGDIVAVAALPLGATGKVQKNELRAQFSEYSLPGA